MRVIAFLDVPDHTDPQDIADSVHARLCDEAGYPADGTVIVPTSTHVYVHADNGRPLAHAANRPFCALCNAYGDHESDDHPSNTATAGGLPLSVV